MEKESLLRFVSQFEAISSASGLLKAKSDSEIIKYYTMDIEKCREVGEQVGLLQFVGDEIERNFYSIKEQDLRVIYAKNTLRLFVYIAPYFDKNTEDMFDENGKFKSHPVGVAAYNGVTQIKQVIYDHCTGVELKEPDSLFFAKEYIIECFVKLLDFSSLFDAKCLSFGIDLEEIQNEVGIFIQRRRRWDILSYYGFSQKEFSLKEKEIQDKQTPVNRTQDDNQSQTEEKLINQSRYTYSDLINILEEMYDQDKIKTQDSINWAKLELEATESIIDKLYVFENDTQRSGFLNTVFRKLFNNGKDYNLGLIKHAGSHNFTIESGFDRDEYKYIENCKCVLNGLIWEVSEACIIYEGIDFNDVMKNSIRSANPYDYVFCLRGTTNSDENVESKVQKKYPEKWYGYFHAIMIKLGKEKAFGNEFTRSQIEEFGVIKYKLSTKGGGFYKAYLEMLSCKLECFVSGLTKDRTEYKKILIDISKNDADIINYLKKWPE